MSGDCNTCGSRPARYARTQECNTCYNRRWRSENPDLAREVNRRYYEENREKVRAAAKRSMTAAHGVDRTDQMPEFDLGKAIKYTAAHQRVHYWRGAARIHDCDHCGAQAQEWAYGYGSPHEMSGRVKRQDGRMVEVAYSPNPLDYAPLCHSCHVKFDRAMAGA